MTCDASNYIFHVCSRVLIFLNSYGHIILFVAFQDD